MPSALLAAALIWIGGVLWRMRRRWMRRREQRLARAIATELAQQLRPLAREVLAERRSIEITIDCPTAPAMQAQRTAST